MFPRASTLLLRLSYLLLLQGCGRYGFDAGKRLIGDAGVDEAFDPATNPEAPEDLDPVPDDDGLDAGDGTARDGGISNIDAGLGTDPPPARFNCADVTGVLMCSSFEDPELKEWTQPKEFNGKSVASEGALIASTGLTGGVAAVYRALPPFQSKDLYLRATIKLPSDYSLTHVDLAMLGRSANNDDTCFSITALSDGMLGVSIGNELLTRTSNFALPRERWFCLAAHITLDPKEGSVDIEVDGVQRFRVEGINTESEATMGTVGVGIHWSSLLQAPAIVLADDFVLSTAPVPCDLTP